MKNFNIKYIVAAVIGVAALMIIGQYAFAVSDCDVECRTAHEDDYNQCLSDCKERNQACVIDQMINETQVAWGDYCANGCKDVDVWDYPACKSYCNSNNRAGVEGETQVATHCFYGPRGYICMPQNKASAENQQLITQFAGAASLRPQPDDQPLCDTDPYWCFNFAAKPKNTMETQHAFFNWIPGFCKKFPKSGVC